MFISLKLKALILTSILVLGLSAFFAFIGSNQLEDLYNSQRTENYSRQKNEIRGLLLQSSSHLQQLTDLLPTLTTPDNRKSNKSILNAHWQYLQINWDLENAALYDKNGKPIGHWGQAIDLTNVTGKISDVAENGMPISTLDCKTLCIQILITPVFNSDNDLQILLLSRSLTDTLRTFNELSQSDVGVLSEPSSDKLNHLDQWKKQATAITNFKEVMPILTKTSTDIDFETLKNSSQTINIDSNRYQIALIPIDNSNNNYFIIVENVTEERTQIESASRNYLMAAIGSVIFFSILIIAMLWQPILRLRKQAELMPMLSQGKFEYVRDAIAHSNRKRWFKDEIDILDNSEMEVSLQLENMQGQIQSHNQELQKLVLFDTLTGLANRRAFHDEIQRCLASKDNTFALLFLDLDNFKRINDSLGHKAGDDLLKIVGKRLNSCVRGTDMVARLGGDEFCVLVRQLRTEDDGRIVATNILNILKNPLRLEATELIVSASIGIVTAPKDGNTTEDLLQNADLAMYKAKAMGRNKYHLFDKSMTKQAIAQLELENELRQALINKEFVLHYQPQIDLKTNSICSVEALVRWQHPTRGLLAPGHFIGPLEETGLIVPLGEWVIIEACEALRRWLDLGIKPIKMSVNLSSRQFQDPKLFPMIEQTLALTKLPPFLLELEVTESMVMHDIENNNRILQLLQKLGTSIAIDDFGTGYSSFSYLKALPLDTLKIDRSFVMDIPNDETDMEITSAIIAVAHKLKLNVVAEGIETVEQQQFLIDEGCDLGQGYLFSKPIDEESLVLLISQDSDFSIAKSANDSSIG